MHFFFIESSKELQVFNDCAVVKDSQSVFSHIIFSKESFTHLTLW